MDLIDLQTGQLVPVDDSEQASAGIINGQFGVPKGSGPVWLFHPEAQEWAQSKPEKLSQNIAQGWRLESPKDAELRQYVQENKGALGAGKAFVSRALNEVALGLPEIVAKKYEEIGSHKATSLDKYRLLGEMWPTVAGAGSVTGFVGPMVATLGTSAVAKGAAYAPINLLGQAAAKAGRAVTGVADDIVAKAVSDRLKKSLIGRAVGSTGRAALQWGTEGAVAASPYALTESVIGDPSAAAEMLISGAKFGALVGGGVAAIKGAVQAPTGIIAAIMRGGESGKAATAEGFSGYLYGKSAITSKPLIDKTIRRYGDIEGPRLLDEVGPFLKDKDISRVFSTAQGDFLRAATEAKNSMKDVVAGMRKLDELESGLFSMDEYTSKVIERIDELKNTVIDAPMKQAFNDLAEAMIVSTNGKARIGIKDAYKDVFAYLGKVKKFDDEAGSARALAAKEMIGIFNDMVFGKVDEVLQRRTSGGLIGETATKYADKLGSDFEAKFRQRYDDYRISKIGAGHLKEKSARLRANNQFSLTDSAIGFGISQAIGGPDLAENFVAAGSQLALSMTAAHFGRRWGQQVIGLGVGKMVDTMRAGANNLNKWAGAMVNVPRTQIGRIAAMEAAPKQISESLGFPEQPDNATTMMAANQSLGELVANPDLLATRLAQVMGPVNQYAPNTSAAMQGKIAEIVNFLQREVPKPQTLGDPFSDEVYAPSDTEIESFRRKLVAATDPMTVLDNIYNNTATSEEIQTLKTLYPHLTNAIGEYITDHAVKAGKKLNYWTKIQMSVLMNRPAAGVNSQQLEALQGSFRPGATQDGPGRPRKTDINFKGTYETEIDRISNR